MVTVFQLLDNIVYLIFLGLPFVLIEGKRATWNSHIVNLLHGFFFGIVIFLVTSTPIELSDGATVDARAGPTLLAGFVAGPLGGLLAAMAGGIARSYVGGSFAFSGMVVFLIYALMGMGLRYFGLILLDRIAGPRSVAIMSGATLVGASLMFFLIKPTERAVLWVQNDLPIIFIANILSVGFCALVIGAALQFLRKSEAIVELNETMNVAQTAGGFGLWDYCIRRGVVKWDKRSRELLGLSELKTEGEIRDWAACVHPDDLQKAEKKFEVTLAEGVPFDDEYRVIHRDGTERKIKGKAIVMNDANGNPARVVGTNLDLTELRSVEAELSEAKDLAARAQKFEMIGQMTGGVAHDFNNLLAVILGNQELLLDLIDAEQFDTVEARLMVETSIDATQRGAELTSNMLSYARKAQLSPILMDLNELVRGTESWLRRAIESRIEIQTQLQSGLWRTSADPASLQSALVNLLVNARDSFSESGRITIKTENISLDEAFTTSSGDTVGPGQYVALCICDTGRGIPADTIENIFDPFFTTKGVGQGSGLGLSMVHGFVKQSGGAITVESQVGVGTQFKLFFPVAAEQILEKAMEMHDSVQPEDDASPVRKILLVEDELAVLDVLRRTLVAAGYDVVTATTGDTARMTFIADPGFDLVVTDIVMPGQLQGPGLAGEIRKTHPKTRFVFLSGYSSDATAHGNGLRPEDVRLMKPVARQTLLTTVRSVLSDKWGASQ